VQTVLSVGADTSHCPDVRILFSGESDSRYLSTDAFGMDAPGMGVAQAATKITGFPNCSETRRVIEPSVENFGAGDGPFSGFGNTI